MRKEDIRKQIDIGEEYFSEGKIDKARSVLEAIAIKTTTVFESAQIMTDLGIIYRRKGYYKEALYNYKHAMNIYEEYGYEEHLKDYLNLLISYALLLKKTGEYKTAHRVFITLLELITEKIGKESKVYSHALNNFGNFYLELGIYDKAEKIFTESAQIRKKLEGENSEHYAESLNNIAVLQLKTGQFDSASQNFEQVLKILKAVGTKNKTVFYYTMKNYCIVLYKMGHISIAEELYRKNLDDLKQETGGMTEEYIRFLLDFAKLQINENHLEEAEKLLDEAKLLSQKNTLSLLFTDILSERVRLNLIRKEVEDAYMQLVEIINIQNSIFLNLSFELSESEALAFLRKINHEYNSLLNLLLTYYKKDSGKIREVYLTTCIRKSIILEITIIQNLFMKRFPFSDGTPEIQKQFDKWLVLKKSEKSEQHEDEIRLIEKKLIAEMPHIEIQERLKAFNAENLFEKIGNESVFLDIVHLDENEKYIMFVLNGNGLIKLVELGSSQKINKLIENYRDEIIRGNGINRRYEHSRRLFKQFFSFLKEKGTHYRFPKEIIISSANETSKISFETLFISEHYGFLIDNTRIRYITTGKELMDINGKTAATDNKSATIIVDPDYDYPEKIAEQPVFKRLRGTQLEGRRTYELLKADHWEIKEYLFDKEACDRRVKEIQKSKVLHIATHGFFNENNPHTNPLRNNGLAFSGINTILSSGTLNSEEQREIEDGALTAYDLTMMNLEDTDVVILSACETGLGKIVNGDGVIGFQRALMMSGVNTMIMTLWKVPDKQSFELMDFFYQTYIKTYDAEESLRQAKIQMLEKDKSLITNPYLWGGYICLTRSLQKSE